MRYVDLSLPLFHLSLRFGTGDCDIDAVIAFPFTHTVKRQVRALPQSAAVAEAITAPLS